MNSVEEPIMVATITYRSRAGGGEGNVAVYYQVTPVLVNPGLDRPALSAGGGDNEF